MRKMDNKGSTLMTVIVTSGFVGLLASVVLLVTSTNVFVKHTDVESKKNFYTAEMVVDEIKMGLQKDMADTMEDAYYDVLSKFDSNETAEDRLINFKEKVLNGKTTVYETYQGFVDVISADKDNKVVSKEKIAKYIDKDLAKSTKITLNNSNVKVSPTDEISLDGSGTNINYDVSSDNASCVIKGLKVRFEEGDYYNEIDTDIRIAIPEPDFSMQDAADDAFKGYSIIAGKQFAVDNVTAKIDGNVWAGDNGIKVDGSSSDLQVTCTHLFSKGNILANTSSSTKVSLMKNSSLALPYVVANGFDVKSSANLNINAQCYIKNDLALNGSNTDVNIKGSYLGFGVDDTYDAEASSSIFVNSKGANLKMDLQNLMLAGRAFVATEDLAGVSSGYDILTGESITLRGNQIAYYVPFKYTPFIGNPVTKATYEKYINDYMTKNSKTKTEAENDLNNLIKSNLMADDIFKEYLDPSEPFRKVIYKANMSGTTDCIYYYLNFASNQKATEYYNYTVATSETLRNSYASLIPAGNIEIKSDTYNVAGNYITKANKESQIIEKNDAPNLDVLGCGRLYKYMRAFLTTTKPAGIIDTSEELSNDAVKNLIDMDTIKKGVALSGSYDRSDYIINSKTSAYKIIVVNNEGNSTYVVPDGYQGMVIATGDVEIKGKMTGLVISNKNIIINKNSELEADAGIISAILKAGNSIKGTVKEADGTEQEMILNEFFNLSSVKEMFSSTGTEMSVVDMDNMCSFENWKKR